jgi:hypothetical protein
VPHIFPTHAPAVSEKWCLQITATVDNTADEHVAVVGHAIKHDVKSGSESPPQTMVPTCGQKAQRRPRILTASGLFALSIAERLRGSTLPPCEVKALREAPGLSSAHVIPPFSRA